MRRRGPRGIPEGFSGTPWGLTPIHKLGGNFKGRWESHLESDWLLIYKLDGEWIVFERTGRHSDLFK